MTFLFEKALFISKTAIGQWRTDSTRRDNLLSLEKTEFIQTNCLETICYWFYLGTSNQTYNNDENTWWAGHDMPKHLKHITSKTDVNEEFGLVIGTIWEEPKRSMWLEIMQGFRKTRLLLH